MKNEKPKNQPAFPNTNSQYREGMTLRDYFAAKAMNGIANLKWVSEDELAKKSYLISDAMLKQRGL